MLMTDTQSTMALLSPVAGLSGVSGVGLSGLSGVGLSGVGLSGSPGFTGVRTVWQTSHLPSLSASTWPVAGIARVSVSPQAEQVRDSTPSTVQVAGVVTVHSPKEWPVAGIVWVSVSPQAQVRVFTPSLVQVAGVVTVHSPKAWV